MFLFFKTKFSVPICCLALQFVCECVFLKFVYLLNFSIFVIVNVIAVVVVIIIFCLVLKIYFRNGRKAKKNINPALKANSKLLRIKMSGNCKSHSKPINLEKINFIFL